MNICLADSSLEMSRLIFYEKKKKKKKKNNNNNEQCGSAAVVVVTLKVNIGMDAMKICNIL